VSARTVENFRNDLTIFLLFSWKCNFYYKTKCPAIVIVDELTECFESQHDHQHDLSLAPKKEVVKKEKHELH
jgi:hypothetical protein